MFQVQKARGPLETRMTRFATLALVALTFCIAAGASRADVCNAPRLATAASEAPGRNQVPAGEIGPALAAAPSLRDLAFTSELHGRELWLDVTRFPATGRLTEVAQALLGVARLADDTFDLLVLADNGRGLFAISEPDLRAAGCSYLGAAPGVVNPLQMLHDLARGFGDYRTGKPLATGFGGGLRADTELALSVVGDVILPQWALSDMR